MSDPLQELSSRLASLVESAQAAVVRIEGGGHAAATATAWSPDTALAAHHSLDWDETVEVVRSDGSRAAGTVAGRDPGTDLVVLKVAGAGLVPPAWDEGEALRAGNLVIALSRPGRRVQARLGLLSAVGDEWRTPAGGRVDRYLQADVALHPGFSGGVLLDAGGRAVGLNTAGLLRGAAMALPLATLRRVTESLLAHGQVRRGYLGIGGQPVRLPPALAQKAGQETGVLLSSVQPGSPAEAAGLVLGDVLLALEGAALAHPGDVLPFVEEERIGRTLPARLLRGGEVREASVVVGARERGAA